jgi:hypothetical protein
MLSSYKMALEGSLVFSVKGAQEVVWTGVLGFI